MKILALDSSGLTASVAVVEDENLMGEYTMNYKKTHSQTLLPMLDELAKMIELDLQSIDAIAVAGGPGSFTGLRIGSATAKGLGLALDKPIVHVPTVDGMNILVESCAVGIEEILEKINEYGRPVVFLGDGVPVFRAIIEEKCRVPYSYAPAHLNRQRAGAVGVLGMEYYKQGKYQSAAEHKPDYLRLSQAERERLEKEKAER